MTEGERTNYFETVQRWEEEHRLLVELGKRVLEIYEEEDQERTRRALQEFSQAAKEHFRSEFIELTRIIASRERHDPETIKAIAKFKTSFQETQKTLLRFLALHCRPDKALDDEFITTFATIMELLGERVRFEENDLYRRLKLS